MSDNNGQGELVIDAPVQKDLYEAGGKFYPADTAFSS